MGAADVVPGVSGGTIALISGIYEELIATIHNLDFGVVKSFKNDGLKKTIENYNLGFLFTLFAGVFCSVISLVSVVNYALNTQPVLLWAFFFGLVVASVIYVAKQISKWSPKLVFALLIGAVFAYYITIITPTQAPQTWYMFFISGAIAIIAMILPGISGSFILVMLGTYGLITGMLSDTITALFSGNWDVVMGNSGYILLFILGCLSGLKLFSGALKWMFAHKKELTLAILIGFMIGSLNRIWPWKKTLSTHIDRHGVVKPLEEISILPVNYEGDPQLALAVVAAIIGFVLIFALERTASNKSVENATK